MFKFELGARLKDVVTGFKGVVIARTDWLNGCRRYLLQSEKLDAGKTTELTIDEEQLSVVGKRLKLPSKATPTGGDHPAAQRHPAATR